VAAIAAGFAALLAPGCGSLNSGAYSGVVVGVVSNASGTCISAVDSEVQSAPGLVCLDHHIAKPGDCVRITASTPATHDSTPLLFPGSLTAVLPRNKCTVDDPST
jgi:hypothetical protein